MLEINHWWCPTCWAYIVAHREEERKRRDEAYKRRVEEEKRERAQIESQIEEMRRKLEVYSSGKTPLPPEFIVPSIAFAQYGLQVMDRILGGIEKERVERLRKECEYAEGVVGQILSVLNRIQSQETTANVSDLIQLCLQLTAPIDILIHLAGVDRTTTLELLCKKASDPNAALQARAMSITALGKIGDQRAVEPLLGILQEGKDDWKLRPIISCASCALVNLGDERAVMPIIKAIWRHIYSGAYGDWTARDYIAERMAVMVRPGTDLYQEVCSAWRTAKEALKGIHPDPSVTTRNNAVVSVLERVLVNCGGHEAIEIAAEWARSGDTKVALKGTKALANLDYEEALDVLCSIVATPRQVTVGYHDEGDMWNIPDDAPNTEQRILAAKALAQRGGPKAMAALQSAASDEDAKVREVIKQLLSDL